jgi:hypothetical protein
MYRNQSKFLKNIITGDKTWHYTYNPETKQQSLCIRQLLLGKTEKGILDATRGKTMPIPFSVSEGVLHHGTRWLTSIHNICK